MNRKGFNLVEIMLVIALIAVIIGIAIPAFVKARVISRARACQENLTKIDGAKESWALSNNKSDGATVSLDTLVAEKYLKKKPICPTGSLYIVNPIGTPPQCSSGLRGHNFNSIGKKYSDWE